MPQNKYRNCHVESEPDGTYAILWSDLTPLADDYQSMFHALADLKEMISTEDARIAQEALNG